MKTRRNCKRRVSSIAAKALAKLHQWFTPETSPRSNVRAYRLGNFQRLEDRRMFSVVLPGPDILVSSPTKPVSNPPAYLSGNALAMDRSTSNYVVVWTGPQATGPQALFAQRFNAAGSPQGTTLVVATLNGGGNQQDPSVAMDPNGNFIVTWTDQPSGSHWNVYARAYQAKGTPLTGSFLVASAPGGDLEDPTVAMNGINTAAITWASHQTGHWQVWAEELQLNGSVMLSPSFLVDTTPSSDQVDPHIAMDSAGNYVITWVGNNAGPWNVYAQQYNSSGTRQGLFAVTNTLLGPGANTSAVGMDSAGDFVITWSAQNFLLGNLDIYAEQFTPSGTGKGVFLVNTVTSDNQQFPSVAMTSGGNFTIAWSSHNQDGNGWGIFGIDYSASGTPLKTSEYQVNTYTNGNQEFPSVAMDDNGHQAFTWLSPTEAGVGESVYTKVNTTPAIVASPVTLQTTASGTSESFEVVLTSQPTGPVTVTFAMSMVGEGTLSSPTVTFTNLTWNTPVLVTVTGMNGLPGTQTYQITATATSWDQAYNGIAMTPVTVTNMAATTTSHTLVVTTNSDIVDGDTSSIANLLANEGPDARISLREAILASNNTPGQNIIYFSIGTGLQTINLLSELPDISVPVIIDGTSQPGFLGQPVIELNGQSAGWSGPGLQISAGNTVIKGLVIAGFNGDGIDITGAGGDVITGNYIGTNVTANAVLANNGYGVYIFNSANNVIGGTTASDRNVVSGNAGDGVFISGIGATGNIVEGDYLGTDATGTVALGNQLDGVLVYNGATDNTIGGINPGAGNLISGNGAFGIDLRGTGTSGNVLQGTFIGTDVTGTQALGNVGPGVAVLGGTNNLIGGTTSAARNIISGNASAGVAIELSGATRNVVEGNYIGTDISGTYAVSNQGDGVQIFGAASGNTIGGLTVTAANVISGNAANGIEIDGGRSSGNVIDGDFIGTDAGGTMALGNAQAGVVLEDSPANFVGSAGSADENVISANGGPGVLIFGSNATGNLLAGNLIGTDVSGNTNLGNNGPGVLITDQGNGVPGNMGGASQNTIGDVASGAGNVIAYNAGAGVSVLSGSGNTIRGNSIFANTFLGIDLAPLGVNPNTASNGQNYPVLTGVERSPTTITIEGTLNNVPNSAVIIDFYASTSADLSGHVEGAKYLGSITVMSDGAGNASFADTLPVALPVNTLITATASISGSNTSEFSAPAPVVDSAIIVTPGTALTTSESRTSQTFWIALAVQPTAPVQIDLTMTQAGQGSLSTTRVIFTPLDWMTPKAVMVTGLDDHLINGNQKYQIVGTASSADPDYDKVTMPSVTVINTEADLARFQLTTTSLTTSEAGTSASFGISLTSIPTHQVKLKLSMSVPGQGILSSSTLTFDASNWNTIQFVTVTGLDDHVANGNQTYQITGTAKSTDSNYDGLTISPITVTNLEADAAGIQVSTNTLTTSEIGTSAQFGVVLTSEPVSPVTINLTMSVPGQGALSRSSLTFDASNWNTVQRVTVTGLDDHIFNGNQSYQITGKVASTDIHYRNIAFQPITVVNTEADVAGIRITPTTGLVLTNQGDKATFTLVLTSQPLGKVTVPVTISGPASASVSQSSVTFTLANWATPASVTVTSLVPNYTGRSVQQDVALGAPASSDRFYAGLKGSVIPVTVLPSAPVGPILGVLVQPAQPPSPVSSVFSMAVSSAAGAGGRKDDSVNAALAYLNSHKSDRSDDASVMVASPVNGSSLTPANGQPYVTVFIPPNSATDMARASAVVSSAQREDFVDLPAQESRTNLVTIMAAARVDIDVAPAQTITFWNVPATVTEQLNSSEAFSEVGHVALTGLIATSGYVLLNTRAGYWLLSLLTSRPLWQQFDPLEVLFAWEQETKPARQDGEKHEETLLSLVE